MLGEEGPALAMGGEITLPASDILAGQGPEADEVVVKALEVRVHHRVGAVGRDDLARPAAILNGSVMRQVVQRPLGRGDHLDPIPFEQGAGPERLGLQGRVDDIIVVVRRLGRQANVQAEHLCIDPVVPDARRRPAEQVVALSEVSPDHAGVGLDRPAVGARHAQVLQLHALAVEHAKDIVVRGDQQFGRILPVLVQGEPGGIGMAVRADDRQVLDLGVEPSGDGPGGRVGREQAVGVQEERLGHQWVVAA